MAAQRRQHGERDPPLTARGGGLGSRVGVTHLAVDFAVRYPRSWGWRQTLGLGVSLLGLAMLLVAIVSFRSVKKVFARDPGRLTVAGPYRWNRNPQTSAGSSLCSASP